MTIPLPNTRDREAWQVAIWNADESVLSRTQKTELMHVLEAGFNSFDPFTVVADLMNHRSLWEAVVMNGGFPTQGRDGTDLWHLHGDLIALRDLSHGYWNVDTLYILLDPPNAPALQKVAGGWKADEINLIDGDPAGQLLGAFGVDRAILRVWWD